MYSHPLRQLSLICVLEVERDQTNLFQQDRSRIAEGRQAPRNNDDRKLLQKGNRIGAAMRNYAARNFCVRSSSSKFASIMNLQAQFGYSSAA
jgi:hypothetical protein